MKLAFVARFLIAFALLTVVADVVHMAHGYGSALAVAGRTVSPALSGWSLERVRPDNSSGSLHFRRGSESMPLRLNLELLALGLLPLLSLIAATPGMSWRQRSTASIAGICGLFVLDLAIVIAYPWMVRNPNPVKDITGTFLGLLTFVGGPVILWFMLTYRHLATFWNLDPAND